MKRSVQVEIAGQKLAIRSDEGPSYVHELAEYVDARIRAFTGGPATFSVQRVSLLVALELADELLRERDLHSKFRASVEAKLDRLEAALATHRERLAGEPDAPQTDGEDAVRSEPAATAADAPLR